MTVKDQVIQELLKAKEPISGPSFAKKLSVSRNAVWKAIEQLRSDGYQIEAIPGQGYQLIDVSIKLSPAQIKAQLDPLWDGLEVFYQDEYDSTNNEAQRYLIDHTNQALFVTGCQTKGRGRRGKAFYSQIDHGVYLSLVVKIPQDQQTQDIPLYTLACASAMAEVLDTYVEGRVMVKWVNDLFYQGRKVSGILCEMTTDLESQSPSHVIVGVGVNLAEKKEDFPDDIQNVAGTLFGGSLPDDFNPNELVASFVNRFGQYQKNIGDRLYLADYQSRLLGLNEKIYYTISGEKNCGIMRGINEMGHLLVEKDDGSIQKLYGQEISLTSQQFASK